MTERRKDRRDVLRVFEAHGVEFIGERGDQRYGSCPFSGKEDKFYVNIKNGLWDSKSAGLSGNVAKFLHLRSKDYEQSLSGKLLRILAENRQLPRDAFRAWEVGWDGKHYTFPVRDFNGNVQDIRRYSLRSKLVMSTPGCRVGLLGAQKLKDSKTPVYVCEGEWDAVALEWLLRLEKEDGIVVAVPGAGTFKQDWVPWLAGRTVHTMYDNDPAGRKGEETITKRLKGNVRKLTYVHWPDEVPIGFDTRDWIVYGVTLRGTPEQCWERLKRRFHDAPKSEDVAITSTEKGRITIRLRKIGQKSKWKKTPPTLAEVHEVFNKWLFLKTTDVIDVVLATVLSQRLDGSPVWTFIVGPPGSAKTAILTSLFGVDGIHPTSTITAPALISGANFSNQGDPSLIPKLDGQVLAVKDFTTVLTLPEREQKEIFGILRDAYDGRCGKIFGNGVERVYESRFTVLAATTPKIYDVSEQNQAMGERFLKFLVGDNMHHIAEQEVIRRAIENADRESVMREELQEVVKAFLERTCKGRKPPTIPEAMKSKFIALARFGARLRGTVSRDWYRNEIVTSRPTTEVGTRLGQQLSKMARAMALLYDRPEVTKHEYDLAKKVMLDTISQRNEDVVRTLVAAMGGAGNLTPLSMRDIANKTHYPFETIRRLIHDLHALQIVKKHGLGAATTWTISEYVQDVMKTSELYTGDEVARVSAVGRIRVKVKKVKRHPRTIRVPLGQVAVSSNGTKISIKDRPAPLATGPTVPATPILRIPLQRTATKS